MSVKRFDLLFRGDLEPGHNLEEVKARMAKLFKASGATIDKLFSGRPVALKKNLDRASAKKYYQALTQAGAKIEVRASLEQAASPPEAKPSLGEGPGGKQSPRSGRALQALPVGADVLTAGERQASRPPAVAVAGLDADLAEAGAELLREAERSSPAPVQVDTSGLSVAPQEGNLVAEDELHHKPAATVTVPDLDLAEVGATLDQEHKPAPPPAPDTSGISLT